MNQWTKRKINWKSSAVVVGAVVRQMLVKLVVNWKREEILKRRGVAMKEVKRSRLVKGSAAVADRHHQPGLYCSNCRLHYCCQQKAHH